MDDGLMLGAGGLAQVDRGPVRVVSIGAAERCIAPAASHHHVNPQLLRAILKVESTLNPRAVGRNGDGTIDVGIGTYVAAWQLSRIVGSHGNTWEAVARYHSATPYFNRRYQILLSNDLVAAGVIAGPRLPVPALRPGGIGPTRFARAGD